MKNVSFSRLWIVVSLPFFLNGLSVAQVEQSVVGSVEPKIRTTAAVSNEPLSRRHSVSQDWHEEIDEKLKKSADFDFVDVPLNDALKQLSKDYNVPFEIDKTAIQDAGYQLDMPISGTAKARSLRAGLNALLNPQGFVCIHWNHSLLITTKEAISNNPGKYVYFALYDVTDLVDDETDEFVKVLQRTIRPQSWLDTNGGPAVISVIKTRKRIVLSIVHTSDGHYEVTGFLSALRKLHEE